MCNASAPIRILPPARREATLRSEPISSVGMAAVVTTLHLALLAGVLPARWPHGRQTAALLIWHQPDGGQTEKRHDQNQAPSNPTHSYSAGRLALAAGMVIMALAYRVQVMRVGTALGR